MAATDRDAVCHRRRRELGLGEAFDDPGDRPVRPAQRGVPGRWARALALDPHRDRLVPADGSTAVVGPGERGGPGGIDPWAAPGAAPVAFDVAGTAFRSLPRRSGGRG